MEDPSIFLLIKIYNETLLSDQVLLGWLFILLLRAQSKKIFTNQDLQSLVKRLFTCLEIHRIPHFFLVRQNRNKTQKDQFPWNKRLEAVYIAFVNLLKLSEADKKIPANYERRLNRNQASAHLFHVNGIFLNSSTKVLKTNCQHFFII